MEIIWIASFRLFDKIKSLAYIEQFEPLDDVRFMIRSTFASTSEMIAQEVSIELWYNASVNINFCNVNVYTCGCADAYIFNNNYNYSGFSSVPKSCLINRRLVKNVIWSGSVPCPDTKVMQVNRQVAMVSFEVFSLLCASRHYVEGST